MEQQQTGTPHNGRGMLWGVCLLALAVVVGVGILTFWPGVLGNRHIEAELQPFGMVPDFTLTERSGQPLHQQDLLGKVWIAAFIFTRCAEECPLISSRMARLQEVFAAEDDVRLVSITVDPEHDTFDVLARYAQHFGAHPQRWLFLTGDKTAIYRLAREGFRLGVVDPNQPAQSSAPSRLPAWRVTWGVLQWLVSPPAFAHHDAAPHATSQQTVQHSARLVLVDRQGQIRAYYDSTDQVALQRLQRDVRFLLHLRQ